jgi:Ni/Co efflux regulator RcnB
MRKYLIPLLMATALTPAMAHARPDRSESDSDSRSERSVQRAERQAADRPARTERNANVDRSSRAEPAPRTERTVGVDRTNRAEHGQRADRPARADRVQPADRDVQPVQEAESPQPVQNSQTNESGRGGLAGAFTQIGHDMIDGRTHDGDDDHDDHDGHDGHHDGDHHDGDHHDGDHHWNHDWRHDHRYDWSSYRNRYRSLFHLGSYYDPYGWGYRRWSVGYSLWPSYYGSNYWLDDPWSYRLPPAYGPYRWVRYYDDAVLVNTYTGEVVDVVYNFFW